MRLNLGPVCSIGSDGHLAILFQESVSRGEGKVPDTKVTFLYQFKDAIGIAFFLGEELSKSFAEIRHTAPANDDDPDVTNILFSLILCDWLRSPSGLLRAIKRKLLVAIQTAEEAERQADEEDRAS